MIGIYNLKYGMGVGKSAQQLKAITAVAWNPGLVPSTHIGGSQALAVPGDLMLFSLHGHLHTSFAQKLNRACTPTHK